MKCYNYRYQLTRSPYKEGVAHERRHQSPHFRGSRTCTRQTFLTEGRRRTAPQNRLERLFHKGVLAGARITFQFDTYKTQGVKRGGFCDNIFFVWGGGGVEFESRVELLGHC